MYRLYLLLLIICLTGLWKISAQPKMSEIAPLYIKITDQKSAPIFGVYVIHKARALLFATSDIDGECRLNLSGFSTTDSLQFQGMDYETVTLSIQDLQQQTVIQMRELQYTLDEAEVKSISLPTLLKQTISKLKQEKGKRIPLCRYYYPALYEKITECLDSAVEYRREYGYYFTSGNIRKKNSWDETFRSYMVPEYTARSYCMTTRGQDTLSPIYLTSDDIRFDVGTRKLFTLIRAVQLYGPLFSGLDYYDVRPLETEDQDYTFTFQTKSPAYPDYTKISCKGRFTIDRERHELKSMDFEYIDYQLLRQSIMSNQRKIGSPFSTRAKITLAYDSNHYYINTCEQTTTWKYDLSNQFLLIEQPSRNQPSRNQLVEKEAFHCTQPQPVPPELQSERILAKIHLAHRFPQGKYDSLLFKQLPRLLDARKAIADLSRYMEIDQQFHKLDNRAYYPENYIKDAGSDSKSQTDYQANLANARKQLFELFGHCPIPPDL